MGKRIIYSPITDVRLKGYLEDCLEIFQTLNIYVPEPVLFRQANSTAWFGQACYLDNSVNLSQYILNDAEAQIKPVIIHELAHLAANDLEPGCGHTGAWKRMATRLSNYTGYSITRTDSSRNHPEWAELKRAQKASRAATQKVYKFICPSCGGKVTYRRQSLFVKTYNHTMRDGSPRWFCRRCDQTLHQKVAFIKDN